LIGCRDPSAASRKLRGSSVGMTAYEDTEEDGQNGCGPLLVGEPQTLRFED